ncbi:HNH endonuclease family protein [Nocardioides coralli]|uniref:HNH endonuclease family protein n=1 Tax=Nocardioides coralli TaxID=2872154 RepID=UPI001CA3CB8B|nr:HNH endonuclease family protein [Nocardioides coralli]QZY30314.1 HNH endonuclease family protein [Nocardioides coralli]
MKHLPALVSVLLVSAVTPLVTASSAEAGRTAAPQARNDTITTTVGRTTKIRVKANDTAFRKRRARVQILRVAPAAARPVAARARGGRAIRFSAPADMAPGTVSIRYRLTDVRGRSDVATVRIRVRPAAPKLLALLDELPVAPEARAGFDRAHFEHWVDADGDGCDTRREVLLQEATAPRLRGGCIFRSGSWHSWYDRVSTRDPRSLHIDHMVPLGEAWASGAHSWTAATRSAFANDLADRRSLTAVTASANQRKGNQDPARWLPAHDQCRYVEHWVAVKARWSLSVDADEKAALLRAFRTHRCGNVPVPVSRARALGGELPQQPEPPVVPEPPVPPQDPETPEPPPGPVGPPISDLPLLDVVAAQDLADRVGVRDFPHYNHTTYGKRPAIEEAIDDLGVEWVTLKYVTNKADVADIERLHAMGVKTILTVGETKGGYKPESAAFWNGLTDKLVQWGDNVPMVVGWNEPNHIRGGGSPLPADWPLRTLRDNIVPLAKAVAAANARMRHQVDVGLPALWSGDTAQFRRDAQKLADVRFTDGTGRVWSAHDTIDAITYHLYPRGGDPTWELDQTIDALRDTFPKADPTPWCTEAGYFTAQNYRGGARNVTEAQQAAYVAKMGLEYFLRGGYVSYFEVSDSPDPSDADREASLGLVDTPTMDPATWRRKPAFTALSTILRHKGGTATRVHADIDAPAGVQRLATRDAAGTVRLYLWRRVTVDAAGRAAPVSVRVTTPAGSRTVQVGGDVTVVTLDG